MFIFVLVQGAFGVVRKAKLSRPGQGHVKTRPPMVSVFYSFYPNNSCNRKVLEKILPKQVGIVLTFSVRVNKFAKWKIGLTSIDGCLQVQHYHRYLFVRLHTNNHTSDLSVHWEVYIHTYSCSVGLTSLEINF